MLKFNYFIIEKIQKWLFFSFAFFLPLSQRISTLNIIALISICILVIKKDQMNSIKGLLYPVILYLIYCFSLVYSSELQFGIIEQKASLLAFPIIFFLKKDISSYVITIFKCFVFACLIALLLCEINAFINSFHFENFTFDTRINKSVSTYHSLKTDENYFFSYSFSFIHQTVYFSMYLLFAISILLFNSRIIKNQKAKNLAIVFLLLGVFQTLNKAGILILFLLTIYFVFCKVNKKKYALIGSILITLIGLVFFIKNPRFENFKKTIFESKYEMGVKDFKKIKNNNPNRGNFRLMLWDSSLDLIIENPILGIGAGGSHNRLYEVFAVKRQWFDKSEKFHSHNQYLQIILDIGILGLIVFLLIIREIIIFKSKKTINNKIFNSFILIVGINFLFESMFERYSGISFFCFFYCLLISTKNINHVRQKTSEGKSCVTSVDLQ